MQLIPSILLISAATVGLHVAVDEFLFSLTGKGSDDYFRHSIIAKPLITCATCMASFWGTVGHFYLGGDFALWPVTVLACAFLNTLFNRWVS